MAGRNDVGGVGSQLVQRLGVLAPVDDKAGPAPINLGEVTTASPTTRMRGPANQKAR